MIKLQRYQIVNLVYRGVGALLIAVAVVLLALDFGPASIVASVSAMVWLVGAAFAQYIFEPALCRWINEEYEREPVAHKPATGETIRL